jgi:type I restriction enzyme R subunit
LDAQVIEDLMSGQSKGETVEEIERLITARIARHLNNPTFVDLGKRLNQLREKYAHGQQASLDFLKELFALARDTVAAEKEVAEVPREERGKAALTELFESLKDNQTPIIVERVVSDVDEVVRSVRFDGWQSTHEGDRLVQQALRKTLYVKFKIRDGEVFDKALGYIREYY